MEWKFNVCVCGVTDLLVTRRWCGMCGERERERERERETDRQTDRRNKVSRLWVFHEHFHWPEGGGGEEKKRGEIGYEL